MNASVTSPESPATTQNWPLRTIAVGVDGSASSLDALRRADQLARLSGASLTVISSWQPPYLYGPVVPPLEWSPEDDARKILNDSVTLTLGADALARITAETPEGAPAVVLIEASRKADLLVVGSRGRGGFTGLLLGSVSSACAEHAACPVLVVHAPATSA